MVMLIARHDAIRVHGPSKIIRIDRSRIHFVQCYFMYTSMLLYIHFDARWSSWRTDRVTHDVYSRVGGPGLNGVCVCGGGGGGVVHMRTT